MTTKKQDKKTASNETAQPSEAEPQETAAVKTVEAKPQETAVVKTVNASMEKPIFASPILEDLALTNPNPAFMKLHGRNLATVKKPEDSDFLKTIQGMEPEMQEKVIALTKTMSKDRPGLYLSDDRPTFTELRLSQGSGNDPMRPENCPVGQMYLTTMKTVGKEFVGTVIALWEGRTLWPARGSTARMPICNSMDRQIGSKYGNCASCPNRPWRTKNMDIMCGDDVVAFMLPHDLSDIVMVRFQRTSAKIGRQLSQFVQKDLVPWQRWFKLTTEKKTGSGDIRWFEYVVEPQKEQVPLTLTKYCALLERAASHDFILPGFARIYRSAAEALGEGQPVDTSTDGETAEPSKSEDGYGDFNV